MRRLLQLTVSLFAIIIIGAGVFILAARSGLLTPSDTALRARYEVPASKFIDIDGEPIHYTDEGRGDAIVLVHGSFGSLRMWSDWVRALSGRYRIIRFDRPPMGLSGPDPKGVYDTDREIHIIDALTTKLGLNRFFLVATSSGALSGAAFAAEHPERIKGLILSNIAVGPYNLGRDNLSPAFKRVLLVDPLFKGWHPQEFWRQILLMNFVDKSKVTPELVREWTDLNNRSQRMPPSPQSKSIRSSLGRTAGDLPHITAPTLVLWSADDRDTPLNPIGLRVLPLLGSKDKSFIVIPRCGHIMPLECGVESVGLAIPFFDRIAASEG